MRSRRVAAVGLGLALALGALVAIPPAHASGTLAWPHFLKVHIEHRRADTEILVDASYAGVGWTTQSGLATGDYLIRVDQDGRIRSLDDKLAINRRSSSGSYPRPRRSTSTRGSSRSGPTIARRSTAV